MHLQHSTITNFFVLCVLSYDDLYFYCLGRATFRNYGICNICHKIVIMNNELHLWRINCLHYENSQCVRDNKIDIINKENSAPLFDRHFLYRNLPLVIKLLTVNIVSSIVSSPKTEEYLKASEKQGTPEIFCENKSTFDGKWKRSEQHQNKTLFALRFAQNTIFALKTAKPRNQKLSENVVHYFYVEKQYSFS